MLYDQENAIFIAWLSETCRETIQDEIENNPFLIIDSCDFVTKNINSVLRQMDLKNEQQWNDDRKIFSDMVVKKMIDILYESTSIQGSSSNTIVAPIAVTNIHPPQRYQPPRNLDVIIAKTRDLMKQEASNNPFLPSVPEDFFERNLDYMLKKIDSHQFKTNLPRLRQMEEDIIVGKLTEEVIERLYDIDSDKGNNNVVTNSDTESIDIEIHDNTPGDVESSGKKVKKPKNFMKRLFRFVFPCIKKKQSLIRNSIFWVFY